MVGRDVRRPHGGLALALFAQRVHHCRVPLKDLFMACVPARMAWAAASIAGQKVARPKFMCARGGSFLCSTFASAPGYNSPAMHGLASICRLAVVASLVCAITAAEVFPRWTGRGIAEASPGRLRVCCCGIQSGTCCGSACCRLPAPVPREQSGGLSSGFDDRGLAIGAAAAPWAEEGRTTPGWPHGRLHAAGAAARDSTLVGLFVRLNI